MKILMIAPTPFFSDRGCHVRIYGEICGLQKLKHTVRLCTYGLGNDVEGIDICRSYNFPWYKKLSAGPSFTKILLLPVLAFTSIRQIHKFKPDIVHAHLHEGAVIARWCSFFYKKPKYFFDMQGSLSGELTQHKAIKGTGFLHNMVRKFENRINSWFPIITQSDNLYKKLVESGIPESKIINAMDGSNVSLFHPMQPDASLLQKYHLSITKPRIIFMGLLEQYQGTDIMFRAFSKVYRQNPDTQFIIIGYPNIEKYKMQCQEYGIADNTVFVGKIGYMDCPRYLSMGDIAVAPKISVAEGDGKIYDYLAMGLPTVAFDRSVSREIMADAGLYAKLADPDDLAEKILFLLGNKQIAQELSKAAYTRAQNYLSWNTVAERITKFHSQFIHADYALKEKSRADH